MDEPPAYTRWVGDGKVERASARVEEGREVGGGMGGAGESQMSSVDPNDNGGKLCSVGDETKVNAPLSKIVAATSDVVVEERGVDLGGIGEVICQRSESDGSMPPYVDDPPTPTASTIGYVSEGERGWPREGGEGIGIASSEESATPVTIAPALARKDNRVATSTALDSRAFKLESWVSNAYSEDSDVSGINLYPHKSRPGSGAWDSPHFDVQHIFEYEKQTKGSRQSSGSSSQRFNGMQTRATTDHTHTQMSNAVIQWCFRSFLGDIFLDYLQVTVSLFEPQGIVGFDIDKFLTIVDPRYRQFCMLLIRSTSLSHLLERIRDSFTISENDDV